MSLPANCPQWMLPGCDPRRQREEPWGCRECGSMRVLRGPLCLRCQFAAEEREG